MSVQHTNPRPQRYGPTTAELHRRRVAAATQGRRSLRRIAFREQEKTRLDGLASRAGEAGIEWVLDGPIGALFRLPGALAASLFVGVGLGLAFDYSISVAGSPETSFAGFIIKYLFYPITFLLEPVINILGGNPVHAAVIAGALIGVVAAGAVGGAGGGKGILLPAAAVGGLWGFLLGEIVTNIVQQVTADPIGRRIGVLAAWWLAFLLGELAGAVVVRVYQSLLPDTGPPRFVRALIAGVIVAAATVLAWDAGALIATHPGAIAGGFVKGIRPVGAVVRTLGQAVAVAFSWLMRTDWAIILLNWLLALVVSMIAFFARDDPHDGFWDWLKEHPTTYFIFLVSWGSAVWALGGTLFGSPTASAAHYALVGAEVVAFPVFFLFLLPTLLLLLLQTVMKCLIKLVAWILKMVRDAFLMARRLLMGAGRKCQDHWRQFPGPLRWLKVQAGGWATRSRRRTEWLAPSPARGRRLARRTAEVLALSIRPLKWIVTACWVAIVGLSAAAWLLACVAWRLFRGGWRLSGDEFALTVRREFVLRKPRNGQGQYQYGLVLSRLGQYEEALAAFRMAVRLNPDNASRDMLGNTLLSLGRYQEALDAFQEAARADPGDVAAHDGCGAIFQQLGQHERALEEFSQALQVAADDLAGHRGRGVALFRLGRHEQALAGFEKLLRLRPDADIWHAIAQTLLRLNRDEEALYASREVLALDAGSIPGRLGCTVAQLRLRRTYKTSVIPADPEEVIEEQIMLAELEETGLFGAGGLAAFFAPPRNTRTGRPGRRRSGRPNEPICALHPTRRG